MNSALRFDVKHDRYMANGHPKNCVEMNEFGYSRVEYSHTQRAPLCLLLYGFGVFCGLLLWSVDDPVGMVLCTSFSLLFAVLGGAFHYLKVEDNGEELAIRFGPIPLFGRKLEYAEIQEVEVSRTILLDGWGIHYSLRGGWVWNLWGFDCVAIGLRNGGTLRIGTNDPENLASFLKQKTDSSSLARD